MYLLGDIILACLVVVFGLTIWIKQKNKKYMKFLDSIPGPSTYPLVGNALDFGSTTDVIPVVMGYVKKHGDITKIWIGPYPMIIICDHNVTETLLSSSQNIYKSKDYDNFTRWLGQGLLTSEPKIWRKHRKVLTPAFHFQILEKYVKLFEEPTKILIRKLRRNVGIKSLNIYSLISLTSLDIICESSMGTKVNAQEDEESEYVKAVKEMGRIIMEKSLSAVKQFEFLYPFTKDYYKERAAIKILHDYTDLVIRKRKEELVKTRNAETDVNVEFYSKKKLSFLDILLLSTIDGQPISDEEIRDEVNTFMFEGHDTTSSGVSFVLYCLANHPEHQQKAYDEQVELFGSEKDPEISLSNLHSMKYLELIIKETLRLYPSVPLYGREVTEDMEVDGQIYPKGLTYYVFTYGLQRNPKYYTDPDRFDPMRFTEMDSKPTFAYVPFSAGPRNCIGQKFAMLEMKYVVSSILRHYMLHVASPNEEPQLAAETILKSKNGIKIRIEERKQQI